MRIPQNAAFASMLQRRPLRYIINGLVAAGVHFLVLFLVFEGLGARSAGLANAIAAMFGVAASFVGNRYYVFRAQSQGAWAQLGRFWLLYVAAAVVHGGTLLLWTDIAGLDYRAGFVIGAGFQAVLTYAGSRSWVFRA